MMVCWHGSALLLFPSRQPCDRPAWDAILRHLARLLPFPRDLSSRRMLPSLAMTVYLPLPLPISSFVQATVTAVTARKDAELATLREQLEQAQAATQVCLRSGGWPGWRCQGSL